jgi:hypothetical protein
LSSAFALTLFWSAAHTLSGVSTTRSPTLPPSRARALKPCACGQARWRIRREEQHARAEDSDDQREDMVSLQDRLCPPFYHRTVAHLISSTKALVLATHSNSTVRYHPTTRHRCVRVGVCGCVPAAASQLHCTRLMITRDAPIECDSKAACCLTHALIIMSHLPS